MSLGFTLRVRLFRYLFNACSCDKATGTHHPISFLLSIAFSQEFHLPVGFAFDLHSWQEKQQLQIPLLKWLQKEAARQSFVILWERTGFLLASLVSITRVSDIPAEADVEGELTGKDDWLALAFAFNSHESGLSLDARDWSEVVRDDDGEVIFSVDVWLSRTPPDRVELEIKGQSWEGYHWKK